jgi:hypothetical protein
MLAWQEALDQQGVHTEDFAHFCKDFVKQYSCQLPEEVRAVQAGAGPWACPAGLAPWTACAPGLERWGGGGGGGRGERRLLLQAAVIRE